MTNVLFPLTEAGSGSDIYTKSLVRGLNLYLDAASHTPPVRADITLLPWWSGYLPPVAGHICDYAGYDIIHSNTWQGYGFCRDIPLVVTEHHLPYDPLYLPYTTLAQRMYYQYVYRCEEKTFACADKVIAISQYTQKKLVEIFGYSDTEMIYNGIDPDLFAPEPVDRAAFGIDDDVSILLYVGNHITRKGADLLRPIMRELGDSYLLLATSGLRTRVDEQESNIRLLGNMSINDLVSVYNLCDMLLFPSRLEGFGLCVAEAMACEKPVVTTDSSSLPELIDQDKGGILCQMDDVSAFVQAVRYLAEDENLRETMGRYNRKKVLEKFTIGEMAGRYAALYRKLCGE